MKEAGCQTAKPSVSRNTYPCFTAGSTTSGTVPRAGFSQVLLQGGGTPAARSERDAFVEMYSQRITQLDAAENGLCFGRLDLAEGERRYIGRIGILDDAADYEALLVDWRAPAARPFYIATAFSPEGVLRRRHIRTRQRTVTGVDDEVLDFAPGSAGRTDGRPGAPG